MSLLVFAFSFFLYIYLIPRNYTLKYQVNDLEIIEKYNKKYKKYYFEIDKKYNFVSSFKYSTKRKLINNITVIDNCIIPEFKAGKIGEMCFVDGYQEVKGIENTKKITTYKDVNIYNYLDTILIWNYRNLNVINQDKNYVVEGTKKDIYSNNLMYLMGDLLIYPNYENEYEYNELNILNLKTNKTETMKLDYTITSDSYILGSYEESIYIVDKKEKKEYELNPYKKKIRIIGSSNKTGKIYENGFKDISLTKLTNENKSFVFDNYYSYIVKDDTLYLKYKDSELLTKVSAFENGHIVYTNEDEVYYLIKDILYYFNPDKGNIKLLQNFEWNFNYINKIFIYK